MGFLTNSLMGAMIHETPFPGKRAILYNSFMSECKSAKNQARCNCSYEPCSRKGVCCDCLAYHWRNRELPACLFPDSVERTYDRSLRRFIQIYKDEA
jgi:hypothetical protein